jgi:hypothetical protein
LVNYGLLKYSIKTRQFLPHLFSLSLIDQIENGEPLLDAKNVFEKMRKKYGRE